MKRLPNKLVCDGDINVIEVRNKQQHQEKNQKKNARR